MTLLLVSDGGLERSACSLMAEALKQQGQHCITAGPPLNGYQPPVADQQQGHRSRSSLESQPNPTTLSRRLRSIRRVR